MGAHEAMTNTSAVHRGFSAVPTSFPSLLEMELQREHQEKVITAKLDCNSECACMKMNEPLSRPPEKLMRACADCERCCCHRPCRCCWLLALFCKVMTGPPSSPLVAVLFPTWKQGIGWKARFDSMSPVGVFAFSSCNTRFI
jgi:hypothetical protein